MLLSTKNLGIEQKNQLIKYLKENNISFITDDINSLTSYKDKLSTELTKTIDKKNNLNIGLINLIVKAAISEQWISSENLTFEFYAEVERAINAELYVFGQKRFEITSVPDEYQKIEETLCAIKDEVELDYDFTFATTDCDFYVPSEQGEIIQLF